MSLERELACALELAERAGRIAIGYFRGEVEVEHKPGNEPVTVADREAQAVIVDGLRRHFPEDDILAEEQSDHSQWGSAERTWLVDPLDGTRDFITRHPGFAVMIGLLREGRPVLGVVYQPVPQITYLGVLGSGAFMLVDGGRAPLRVSEVREGRALRLVASRSHRSATIDRVKQAVGITDEQNLGSVGLKVGLIARGLRDIYLHPEGRCRLWDTCAPEAILVEAGGRMTDLHGDPIRYSPTAIALRHGLVASNSVCHDSVLAAIAPIFPRPSSTR